jgi:hypothetical protein
MDEHRVRNKSFFFNTCVNSLIDFMENPNIFIVHILSSKNYLDSFHKNLNIFAKSAEMFVNLFLIKEVYGTKSFYSQCPSSHHDFLCLI